MSRLANSWMHSPENRIDQDMDDSAINLPAEFVVAIHDAVELLDASSTKRPAQLSRDPLPSLLDQCIELLNTEPGMDASGPIRTVHHLACTGGTLIAKCLAAMPNVQLLSEVHPFSDMPSKSQTRFFPTDLTQLALTSTRGVNNKLVADIFRAGLSALHEDSRQRGLRLVLRDHSHSQFCFGPLEPESDGLREVLIGEFDLRSIVTVRHPIDSFLSLINNDWRHFNPFTLDEYARRYLTFLDVFSDCEVFRYEDFTASPEESMQRMCGILELPFNPEFAQTFFAFTLSGDSGRSGTTIKQRQRREVPDELRSDAEKSSLWSQLCERLEYDPAI